MGVIHPTRLARYLLEATLIGSCRSRALNLLISFEGARVLEATDDPSKKRVVPA